MNSSTLYFSGRHGTWCIGVIQESRLVVTLLSSMIASEIILVITIPSNRKAGKGMKEKAGNVSQVCPIHAYISSRIIQWWKTYHMATPSCKGHWEMWSQAQQPQTRYKSYSRTRDSKLQPKGQISGPLVLWTKFYWEHSHTYSLSVTTLPATETELSSYDRPYGLQSLKLFIIQPFIENICYSLLQKKKKNGRMDSVW